MRHQGFNPRHEIGGLPIVEKCRWENIIDTHRYQFIFSVSVLCFRNHILGCDGVSKPNCNNDGCSIQRPCDVAAPLLPGGIVRSQKTFQPCFSRAATID